MSEQFDPYLQWLGIRDPERPPNHYRLLGIELFETDMDVIATAADRQMAHVRTFAGGKNSAVSQQILNELAAAKICLLNEAKKLEYDDQLFAKIGPTSPPPMPDADSQTIDGVATSIGVTDVDDFDVVVHNDSFQLNRPGKKRRSNALQIVGVGVITFALVGAAAYLYWMKPWQTTDVELSNVAPGLPTQDANDDNETSPVANETNPDVSNRVVAIPTEDVSTTSDGPNVAPWDRAESDETLEFSTETSAGAVVLALSNRDLDTAFAVFSANFSDTQFNNGENLRALLFTLEQFWESVNQATDEIRQATELSFAGETVRVINRQGGKLRLQSNSKQVKDFSLARHEIDARLVRALVEYQYRDAPALAWRLVGTFLSIDKQGDVKEGRNLLAKARSAGFPAAELTVIDSLLAGDSKKSESAEDVFSSQDDEEVELHPVPGEAATSMAKREVRKEFNAFYSDKTSRGQLQLALELRRQAESAQRKPPIRFAMLEMSRDIGVRQGGAATIIGANRNLAREFDIVFAEEMTNSLEAIKPGREVSSADLVQATFDLAMEEMRRESYRVTNEMLDWIESVASSNPASSEKISLARGRLKERVDLDNRVRLARVRLNANKDDPSAHETLGFYYCFVKSDFRRGLPHLAKGMNKKLIDVAISDLMTTTRPNRTLSDAWERIAKTQRGLIRNGMLERSRHWLEEKEPN